MIRKQLVKKLLISLFVSFTFIFASCHEIIPLPSTFNPNQDSEYTIAVFLYDKQDAFIGSIVDSMNSSFDKLKSQGYVIKVDYYDAKNNEPTQIKQIKDAIKSGIDTMVVNTVAVKDKEEFEDIINISKANGIPLIFFNRSPPSDFNQDVNADDNIYIVKSDDPKKAGGLQAMILEDNYLNNVSSGDLKYIVLQGGVGNIETIERTKQARKSLDSFYKENVTLTELDESKAGLVGAWKRSEAKRLVADLLANPSTKPNVNIVVANNDEMALGAIEAIKEAGLSTNSSDPSFIPVVGVDGMTEAIKMVKSGNMLGTVLQDPKHQGEAVVNIIKIVSIRGENLAQNNDEYREELPYIHGSKYLVPYKRYDAVTP